MRRARGQSGLEYMSNYLFLVIAVVIVAVVLWQSRANYLAPPVKSASGFGHFQVIDFGLAGNTPSETANTFQMALQTLDESDDTVVNITVSSAGLGQCGATNFTTPVRARPGSPLMVVGNLFQNCTANQNDYEYDLVITYAGKSGIPHDDRGTLRGRFEDLGPLMVNYGWHATNFAGNVMTTENGNALASYNGVCPAVPPNLSAIPVAPSDYLTWSQPGSCSGGGLTGVSFATAACNRNASYLAHGWVATTVWASQAYSGKRFYLGGPATYTDANGTHSGYICVNDNFYFYVNGVVVSRGGTTGVIGPEVIRTCDAGSCSASDGWCIPPVEVGASTAFNFGENNTIAVLLEDYCVSGGIRIPSFYFV